MLTSTSIQAFSFASALGLAFSSSALAQCTNDGIRAGLVARYTFNDGTATDSSGFNHDGAVFGAVPASGIDSGGFSFASNDHDIVIADTPTLNPSAISVSAWWFSESFSGSGSDPLVDKGYFSHNPPYYQYHLNVTGNFYPSTPGSFGFTVSTTAGNVGVNTDAHVWTPGNWYHIVGTYSGTEARIYINGTLIATQAASPGTILNFGRPLHIGHFTNLPLALRGTIDEVRIFDRALSADEVSYLYNNPDDAPGFIAHPQSQAFCQGNASVFTATLTGATPISYQWFKDGNLLTDSSSVSGSNGPTLTITNAQSTDAGAYSLAITTSCGTFTSNQATLQVCLANFNCDSAVDFFDYLDFVAAFSSNASSADFNADTTIDFFDYLDFVAAFSSGC